MSYLPAGTVYGTLLNFQDLNYTLFHPTGGCALISPWNVPFMTATWKVAPCLAFGNTAVLTMSELSPLSAAQLAELALEAAVFMIFGNNGKRCTAGSRIPVRISAARARGRSMPCFR